MNGNQKIAYVPLPRVPSEWVRKLQFGQTINDHVEAVHIMLLNEADNEEYLKLLEAVHDEQAVEGSLSADNLMAARKIREVAERIKNPVRKLKLATISKALNVVMRRYEVSRKERKHMVGGKVVPNDGNE